MDVILLWFNDVDYGKFKRKLIEVWKVLYVVLTIVFYFIFSIFGKVLFKKFVLFVVMKMK